MEFNQFLLEKCWVNYGQFYKDREDFQNHYDSGEVTMPIPDVLKIHEEFKKEMPDLPSRFKNGDKVSLDFKTAGKVNQCEIIKVHFSKSKVLYDVEIRITPMPAIVNSSEVGLVDISHNFTRLYNVDSCFVVPANDEPFYETGKMQYEIK